MPKPVTLFDQKALLAKILARENIHIVHRKCSTAMFHLRTRTLTIPIFKDKYMTGDVYDLCVLHEISHALHTPEEGWHEAEAPAGKGYGYRSYMNVVEDARIEKLIKRRYPGAVKCMIAGYKVLNDMDFFGVKKIYHGDYTHMKLIDRLNIHMKLGASELVPFTDAEKYWIHRMETLETFEDVRKLTDELYLAEKEHEKERRQQEKQQQKPKPQEDEEDEEQGGESEQSDDGEEVPGDEIEGDEDDNQGADDLKPDDKDDGKGDDEESDGEKDDKDEGKDTSSGEDDSSDSEDEEEDEGDSEHDVGSDGTQPDKPPVPDEPSSGGDEGGQSEEPEPEPESHTDNEFREHEQDLSNERGKGIIYFDIPEADLKKVIIPLADNIKTFEREVRRSIADYHNMGNKNAKLDYDKVADELWAVFYRKNVAYVNQLVKEFMLKKNATQYARTQIARSGELDLNRIARYMLTDDLFRRTTTVTKGKSHGLIMYIDWSGSMDDIFMDTMEQMLILTMFCKKVNIPFDVYAYSDTHYGGGNGDKFRGRHGKSQTLEVSSRGGFMLQHLISSESAMPEYKAAQKMLIMMAYCYNTRDKEVEDIIGRYQYTHGASSGVHLGGTPTNAMLVCSRWMIPKFQAKTKVDVVNVIHLTDGDGGDRLEPPFLDRDCKFYIKDPVTCMWAEPKEWNTQTALTQLVRYVTNCRHIGVYVGGDKQSVKYKASESELPTEVINKMFEKNGYAKVPIRGYDNYFLMPSYNVTAFTDVLKVRGDSQEDLIEGMRKLATCQRQTRAMCTEFADEICEQLKLS